VTPEARKAQALVTAAIRASSGVAPSTDRQALRPPKSMQTSHRTAPVTRLDPTTIAPITRSTPSVTHEVRCTPRW
jgi:hypothetical protein